MKPRTLAILALVTLFFAVAAVVVNSRGPAYTEASGGQLVFPDLDKKINDAASITVEASGKSFTVKRTDKGWVVADKYDYPAKFDVVKQTLVGLAQLKTVEAKTADPSLYSRLQVEDPKEKDAKSALIAVADAQGNSLAKLIVGKNDYNASTNQGTLIYVRQPDDKQSWLAQGTLERNDDVKQWMDRELVQLAPERVREVTVTPADGKPFLVHKDKPGSGDFTLDGVPSDDKVKSAYDVNAIGGALALLSLDDVLPAKDLKPDAKLLRTLDYKSFDGLVVDLALYQQDGKTWARIKASFDPAAAAAKPASPSGNAKAGTSTAAAAADSSAALKSVDAVKKDVAAITARTQDWAYGLEESDLATLEKKFDDLIEPKTPSKPKS